VEERRYPSVVKFVDAAVLKKGGSIVASFKNTFYSLSHRSTDGNVQDSEVEYKQH
jgi:hypothetical protein